MRRNVAVLFFILIIAVAGCGRKLPPLPPEKPNPIEILSIRFEGDEVIAKAICNMPQAEVSLLGKPKGTCPECKDDLVVKQRLILDRTGEVVLKDHTPQAQEMVYCISIEKGTFKWTTPPKIVVKDNKFIR